ncbi:MAG: FAD-dependent oxidoreductase [Pseudomonadota bacterium]
MSAIIIVGSGLAGYTLAKELRKTDKETPITIITRDDGRFYSKPMLSNGLSKNKTADQLATQTAEQMAESQQLTVLTDTEVASINVNDQSVSVDGRTGSQTIEYSHLVLALGASQIRLPIEGDGVDSILTVNDLADYAVFRDRLESAQRVALIGPGLIGCEFANDLVSIGKKVTVIGPDKWPLERLMPQMAGEALKGVLSGQGVSWILGNVVKRVDSVSGGFQLTLDNGDTLEADLVLSAAGLVSNTALAADAGLAINRGVVVDQYLRTSHNNVYALGDCAEICGLVMPYVMPIMIGAKALAKTLGGEATKANFPAMPVAVKTPSHPIVVSPPADFGAGDWDSEAAEGDPQNGVKSRFVDAEGTLLGFTLTGSTVIEKMVLQRELPAVLPDE